MKYQYIQSDLFAFEGKRDLVHCISYDFRMGAGIAKEFAKRGIKEQLTNDSAISCYAKLKGWRGNGYVIPVRYNGKRVWNLITKEHYWEKPTYQALVEALESLKDYIFFNDIDKEGQVELAMPKIGCGLDRLDWGAVEPIIQTIFENTDFDIIVCYR